MCKDPRLNELRSIMMMMVWERRNGALPFNTMGGFRFRESRWHVTSWPHTWLPAAVSLSVRGPPAAALSESPLRCHVSRSTVCDPPLRVPGAPLCADGAYWSTAEDVTFALQIRAAWEDAHSVVWGRNVFWVWQKNQFNSTRELHLKHDWNGLNVISKVNGKNRWSIWQVIKYTFSIIQIAVHCNIRMNCSDTAISLIRGIIDSLKEFTLKSTHITFILLWKTKEALKNVPAALFHSLTCMRTEASKWTQRTIIMS